MYPLLDFPAEVQNRPRLRAIECDGSDFGLLSVNLIYNNHPSEMGLTVILNPSSGAKRASHCSSPFCFRKLTLTLTLSSVFENILAPFLKSAGVSFDLLETKSDGDGERLGRLLRSRWEANHEERRDQETKLVCAVLGGDGTSHGSCFIIFF